MKVTTHLKTGLSYLLYLLPLTCFGAATEDGHEKFVTEFIAAYNAVHEDTIDHRDVNDVQEISNRGVCSSGIYIVTLANRGPIVCKGVFGEITAKNLLYCQKHFIEQYEHDTDETYPRFVRYLGSFSYKGFVTLGERDDIACGLYGTMSRTILMFALAQGELLTSIFCQRPLDEQLIKRVAKSLAKFHAYSLEERDGVPYAIVHGDLHSDNIFVAIKPAPSLGGKPMLFVTFIDYDELVYSLYQGKRATSGELDWFFTRTKQLVLKRCPTIDGIDYCLQNFRRHYDAALPKDVDDCEKSSSSD